MKNIKKKGTKINPTQTKIRIPDPRRSKNNKIKETQKPITNIKIYTQIEQSKMKGTKEEKV